MHHSCPKMARNALCGSFFDRSLYLILAYLRFIDFQNLILWSLRCFMAQDADPPDPFQMLQILYKSFTKRGILEPLALRGSGGRSARSLPKASNPLQILYKTEHSGASGASWLRRPIRQILSKCFKSFTNPLQIGACWSLGRLVAQEAEPPHPFQMLQILYKSF